MFGRIFGGRSGGGGGNAPSGAFFGKTDWLSFWGATLVSFGVYFFTLGPSVGMEDSGELATAGDHLGVPHPPGYPLWTMCAWAFCRVFSWVSYQGHPTPAWAISLMSAVFGALAAGCTAMLITRSARDMLQGEAGEGASPRHRDMMALAGGLGGSLVFAFSPVMWSQATIVEIYSLNALFLMWVLLLTYRWMRRPSDKILWLTAFVFGLGLTNYQVLLFAAVPLVLTILFTEIALFRDFFFMLIPVGLTAHLLGVVSNDTAAGAPPRRWAFGQALNTAQIFDRATGRIVDVKDSAMAACHRSDVVLDCVPDSTLLWTGAALVAFAVLAGAAVRKYAARRAAAAAKETGMPQYLAGNPYLAACTAFGTCIAGAAAILLSMLFSGSYTWFGLGPADKLKYALTPELTRAWIGSRSWPEPLLDAAPLASPLLYATIAALLAVSIACALYLAFLPDERWCERLERKGARAALAGMCMAALAAVLAPALALDSAAAQPAGPEFSWTMHAILLFAGVAAMGLMAWKLPRGAMFAVPATGVQLALFTLASKGALTGLTDPNTWWFAWPIVWNFAILALAWAALPNGRRAAIAAFAAELGVSFYAYMPIVSDLRNPPMNWAYPRTWKGFKHAITRGQYEAIGFLDGGFEKLGDQFGSYLSDLRLQFTLVAATLALIPFAAWTWRGASGRKRSALSIAAVLYLVVAALVVASEIYGGEPPWRIDKWITALLGVLVTCGLFAILREQAGKLWRKAVHPLPPTPPASGRNGVAAKTGGAAAGAEKDDADNLDETAYDSETPASADRSEPPRFSVDDVSQRWLLCTGAGFFMMSFVLIMLANTRGDIQDGFIQKVKFISSHGIFSVWIGYGLAFGLAVANRWLVPALRHSPFRRLVQGTLLAAASLVFLIPVYENYTNDDLIMRMGSAEQNGHTFGWQFGAYQLEGNRAIAPELSADEEPLPDPDWPPPMTTNAFFFGGSDPGRFVPTYMIYSADYRPDVHLITQNALADGTYMSVERDLYGSDIWIPDVDDSQRAFWEYDSENPGSSGDGKIEVKGALEVMKINAKLARMMFDRERLRRDFYIEESYPIPWMYPYLLPHGLIMKLDGDPAIDGKSPLHVPLPRKTVNADMDFWDWYVRRLLRDPAFRRDFAAQKNFSKLRCAIAMLYSSRGLAAESARAARDACHLYPISTESVMRNFERHQSRHPALRMTADPAARPGTPPDLAFFADSLDRALSGMAYLHSKDPKHEAAASYAERCRRAVESLRKAAAEGKRLPDTAACAEISAYLRDINRPDLMLHFLNAVLMDESFADFDAIYECMMCGEMLRHTDLSFAFVQKLMGAILLRENRSAGEAWMRNPENGDKIYFAARIALEGAIYAAAGADKDEKDLKRLAILGECAEFFFAAFAKSMEESDRCDRNLAALKDLLRVQNQIRRAAGADLQQMLLSRIAGRCAGFALRKGSGAKRAQAVEALRREVRLSEFEHSRKNAADGGQTGKSPWRTLLGDGAVNSLLSQGAPGFSPGAARPHRLF